MFNHKFKPGPQANWDTCQHPECGLHISAHVDKMDAIEKRTMENIIEYGQQVNFIFPRTEGDGAQFWYSVGRSLHYQPEFLLTGPLPQPVGHFIVNQAARLYDESPFQGGDELPPDTLLANFPVRIIEADPIAAHLLQATSWFDDVRALQIVWPDAAGYFPGEGAYAYGPEVQPLYPKARA